MNDRTQAEALEVLATLHGADREELAEAMEFFLECAAGVKRLMEASPVRPGTLCVSGRVKGGRVKAKGVRA